MSPSISILMSVKNTAPYLEECLNSILQQSFTNWELLAVNDHSEDQSNEILQAYAKNDSRIKVLQNKEKGIIPALRLAYKNASGAFITRMDSDDICCHNKLESLHKSLLDHGKGHIALGQVKYFSDGYLGEGYLKYAQWLNQLTARGNNFSEIYKECVIPSPCWMLHSSDLENCDAFNAEIYPEDYELCFRWYQNGLKPIASNQVLHLWRDRADRSSRTDPNYSDNHFSELKLKYFLKIDKDKNRPLVLWGTGKRGKKIAKILNREKVDFHWICNNPNKTGKIIYNQLIHNTYFKDQLPHAQLIIAVSNPEAQKDIRQELIARQFKKKKDYFFFC